MKIGIFGGTFDPPHLGHIGICKAFLDKLSLDKLFVIPASIPPHKEISSNTTVEQRLQMTKLAFEKLSDNIIVSDIEIKRQGKSFTADTLSAFLSQGYENLFLLCGTDMLLSLDKWYNAEYIFKCATIVFARRENEEINTRLIEEKIDLYKKEYNARILPLDANVFEISSTDIRNAISMGEVADYLSSDVFSYIKQNNLYKEDLK